MSTEDVYLKSVERMLQSIAPEHRTAVIDDLRGHFAEAEDAGRPVDDTIRGLGSPREIAERAVEEFGSNAEQREAAAEHAWRVLQSATVGASVVIGMVAAFVMPTFRTDRGELTLFEMDGLWAALIPLLPVVVATLPLMVPRAARTALAAVSIVLQLALTVLLWSTFNGLFLPIVLLSAGALLVWVRLHGRGLGLSWRITAAILAALPIAALLSGAFIGGSLSLEPLAWVVVAAALGIAVLIAMGVRFAGWALAALGVVALLSGLLSGGLLTLLFVWVGGWWLTIGLVHAVGTPRRR